MNTTIEPGSVVDQKFEIISVLGRGGMGTVYRAMQRGLDRMVALKFLQTEMVEDEESKQRFLREAHALSVLTHKNIAAFYSYGIWQNQIPYIAMELLEGQSLSEVLSSEGQLGWARSCAIIEQVSDAMDYAHNAGIIHRDLKPGNIVLLKQNVQESSDFVKVMDFGLSKVSAQSGGQRLTLTGELIGSVKYMSPEQCAGMPASSRSDIYSLACIFYECITGKAPHDADNPIGLIHKHANEEVLAPSQQSKTNLPPGLDEVILKALEKDPEHRYQSMAELRADIIDVSAGRGSLLEIFSQSPQTKSKPLQKSPFPAPLLTVLFVILITGTIGFFLLKPSSFSNDKTNPYKVAISMSSQQASRVIDQARAEFAKGYVDDAISILQKVLDAKTSTNIRLTALMDMAIAYSSKNNSTLENECLDEVILICTRTGRKDRSISKVLQQYLADALASKVTGYIKRHDLERAEETLVRYNKLAEHLETQSGRTAQILFLNGTLASNKNPNDGIAFYTRYADKRSNDSLKLQALLLRLTLKMTAKDREKYEKEYFDCMSKMDESQNFSVYKIREWLGYTDYSRHLISKAEPIIRKKYAWRLADECELIEQLGHDYVQNSETLPKETIDKLRSGFVFDLTAATALPAGNKPIKHIPVMIICRNITHYYGKQQALQFMNTVLKICDEKKLCTQDERHQLIIEAFSIAPGSLHRTDLDQLNTLSEDPAVAIDQRAVARSIIGHYYRENKLYDDALKYYNETLKIARSSPKGRMAEASASVWMGLIYDQKNDPVAADKFYWDAFMAKCQIDPTYVPLARTSRNEVLNVMKLAKHEIQHAEMIEKINQYVSQLEKK